VPEFDDATTTAAGVLAVWKILYDPLRFPQWWTGVGQVHAGDVNGQGADITMYPDGYPDFAMPQRVDSSSQEHRVVVSCTISDLVFDWGLQPLDAGTRISVHVEIPEREAARLATQREVVETSLRRPARLAEDS
jgi:uncharacterized protein YndB with AHSA1/START domain